MRQTPVARSTTRARTPRVSLRLARWIDAAYEGAVIRGRFSDGLDVGVIPMHLVTRMGVPPLGGSIVVH